MQQNITRKASNQNGQRRRPLANPEIEGFKQIFDYQKAPVGKILWTSRDSVVRIIPGNDGSNFFPQVINADIWTQDENQATYLSDTFYMVDTVDHFGEASMDLVSSFAPGSHDQEIYPESPLNYFCNSIHRAVRAVMTGKKTRLKVQDVWRSWTNMGGPLPYPKQTLFFQAICQMLNGSPCKKGFEEGAEEGLLYGIIGITHRESIQELYKALVFPMDRRKPIGTDNNTFGSLAELEGNWLFLNTAVNDKGKKYLLPSVQASDAPTTSWECTPMNLSEEEAKALWTPWEKAFNYMTAKEQVDLLCAEFGTDTVQYILEQDKSFEGIDFPVKVSMASSKPSPQPRQAPKPSGLSSAISSLKKPQPKAAPAEEEPAWNPPQRVAGPVNSPEVQAVINKIKQQKTGGAPTDLAKDVLADVNLDDLGM